MLVKFVLLLFCCALINAKSLVQRDPRLEGHGEIRHAKLPDTFKDLIRGERDDDVVGWNGGDKVGTNMQVEEEDEEEESPEELTEDVNSQNEEAGTQQKEEEKREAEAEDDNDDDDDDDDDDDNDDDDETKDKNGNEENHEEKGEEEEEEEEEEDDDDDDGSIKSGKNEEENNDDEKTKEPNAKKEGEDEVAELDEEDGDDIGEKDDDDHDRDRDSPHPSDVLVGDAGDFAHLETLKFPKQSLNLPPQALQSSENNNLLKTLPNLFDVESLINNFLPSKDSSPKEHLKETKTDFAMDDDTLIANLAQYESAADTENNQVTADQPASKYTTNIDYKSLVNFVSQAVPKSFDDLQAKFQDFTNSLQKNIKGQIQQLAHKEPKVGFGGWDSNKKSQLVFGNTTNYVNKAVERAQAQLEEHGRKINADNPPLTINLIPGTPIIFKLKYVEGAHTLDKYGQSKAIRYNKLYAFTQYKFTELRYYYDVIIRPFNLYGIRKSITVILNDAKTKMNLSVGKDSKVDILGLEFVNPEIMVDFNTHRFINYGLNYLVNDVHPVIRQKLVEIVSRDSKMMLLNYLKDAQ